MSSTARAKTIGKRVVPVVAGCCLAAPLSLLISVLLQILGIWELSLGQFATVLLATLVLEWVIAWLWVRLTYQIGVRLFFSYLLIGLIPVPLFCVLLGLLTYVILGQYAAVQVGARLDSIEAELADRVAAASVHDDGDVAPTVLGREGVGDLRGAPRWVIASTDGTIEATSEAAAPPIPTWVTDGAREQGFFLLDGIPVKAAVERRGERLIAAWVRLDIDTASELGRDGWWGLQFSASDRVKTSTDDGFNVSISEVEDEDDQNEDQTPRPELLSAKPLAGTLDDSGDGGAWWRNRWLYFTRLDLPLRDWTDGEAYEERPVTTVLRTSVFESVGDLFRTPYGLGNLIHVFFIGFFAVAMSAYSFVVLIAAWIILSIVLSTARLSRGARAIEAGDLSYRIPVRQEDQLGDLAASFNNMTAAVEDMMAGAAERERLARELELAREIQRSLLPGERFRHGAYALTAHVRPAAEIGGDYFDLFADGDHLLLSAGDVAGHGTSTGLVMAMIKSAVATLVREGYRRTEVLERLNQLMLAQPRSLRMVTFVLIELDAEGHGTFTNAGHPPPLVSGPDGVEELLAPSLPVGFRWPQPPRSRSFVLPPGGRLVVYSDGLVEAVNADDEPFGFDQLREVVATHTEASAHGLLEAVLSALVAHTGSRDLDDDLTLLVVERERPEAKESDESEPEESEAEEASDEDTEPEGDEVVDEAEEEASST